MKEEHRMKERKLIPGDLYQHFKGNLYQIITTGVNSETGEEMVVYQAMYGDFQVYIRPLHMFLETLDLEKYPDAEQKYRFTLVKSAYQSDTKETIDYSRVVQEESKNTAEKKEEITKENFSKANGEGKEKQHLEELYLAFFDAETSKEKLEILQAIKEDMDERMLNNIAASMDLPIDGDKFEEAYEIIAKNLEQRSRFECSRFR